MRAALTLALVLSLSSAAWAAGGGNGGGGKGGGTGGGGQSSGNAGNGGSGGQVQRPVKTCASGYVYDKHKKSCVGKSSTNLPLGEILEQGWLLAKSGQFADGRELFAVAAKREPANPEALNGLGYTNRKLGNFDIAFDYYNQALRLDPNYLDAREYLGEGYAVAGQIDLAKLQLAEIAARGGTQIEQYEELADAIAQAVKNAAAE